MSFFNKVQRKINTETHSTGAKIRKIRLMKNISAKAIGKACGVNDMAVRNYELGQRQPNEQKLRDIADCLGVNISSLYDRKIESYIDVMHILFEMEVDYGIYPCDLEKYPCISIISKDDTLIECFRRWKKKREEWENQVITDEDYINWKNAFPDNLEEYTYSEDSKKENIYTELEMKIYRRQFLGDLKRMKDDKMELIRNSLETGDIGTVYSILEEFDSTFDYLIEDANKKGF